MKGPEVTVRVFLFLYILLVVLAPGSLWAQTAADADFDGSGTVDFPDFVAFAQAFGSGQAGFDFDGSGTVDFPDFVTFAGLFGQTVASVSVREKNFTTSAGTEHQMALVPAGEFRMGSDEGEKEERPAHTVFLDAYWIDKFEVVHAQYVVFLNSVEPQFDSSITPSWAIGNNRYLNLTDPDVLIRQVGEAFELKSLAVSNHPMGEVTWFGAKAYCEWMGGRLPTEAEWEKAARGTDGRTYPWGNELDPRRANYSLSDDPFGEGTTPVGFYDGSEREGYQTLDGRSPYGLYDMAGNVWEWVLDTYDGEYYAKSPRENPKGPGDGGSYLTRGGSWQHESNELPVFRRRGGIPGDANFQYLGFRCVREPEP